MLDFLLKSLNSKNSFYCISYKLCLPEVSVIKTALANKNLQNY